VKVLRGGEVLHLRRALGKDPGEKHSQFQKDPHLPAKKEFLSEKRGKGVT